MNYNRIYNELIENAKQRNWTKKTAPEYVEQHHIVPRSLEGSDCADNLVFLTYQEHFLGHWLLYKLSTGPNKAKMANAWFRMCQSNKFQNRNGKHYAKARQAFSDNNPFKEPKVVELVKHRMTKNNPMKNPETVAKVSKALKGKRTGIDNLFFGQKHTKETLHKVSGENHYSKQADYIRPKVSDETCKKIQKSKLGKPNPGAIIANKNKAETWKIITPENEAIVVKNLNQWALENNVSAHWLYRSRHGYKVEKI